MSRNPQKAASLLPQNMGGEAAAGTLRLRVLWSLPQAHQKHLFDEVKKLCGAYVRRNSPSGITTEDLVSEVWEKFLGATSLRDKDEDPHTEPSQSTIDPHDPECDGRVVWLQKEMQSICSNQALAHRCEDIRRKLWGRALPQGVRRIVQSEEGDDFDESSSDSDQEHSLVEADSRAVWRGLLLLMEQELPSDDDVTRVLSTIKKEPDIFESSSTRWPVGTLIRLLSRDFPPPPPWDDNRVDNAKRRLKRWIQGLKKRNGLDDIDLEALFARVAYRQDLGEGLVREVSRPTRLHS